MLSEHSPTCTVEELGCRITQKAEGPGEPSHVLLRGEVGGRPLLFLEVPLVAVLKSFPFWELNVDIYNISESDISSF